MAGFLVANILINLLQIFTFIIDFITLPIYCIIQRPWQQKSLMKKKYAEPVSSGENEVTYRSIEEKHGLCKEAEQKGIDTMEKMLNFLRLKFATRPCIGTRQILSVEQEVSPDTGKVLKKYNMGEYLWITYDQMFNRALAFGRGVKELGYPPKTKVVMYADTRGEYEYIPNLHSLLYRLIFLYHLNKNIILYFLLCIF